MIVFSELNKTNTWGRLGNNLFSIAATIGTAVKHGMPYGFPDWRYRTYFKNQFPIMQDLNYQVYHEPHFHYSEINVTGNTDLRGYFQSKKYWQHCSDLIRDQFTFTNPPRLSIQNAVSVHVRRGDYIKWGEYHYNLGMNYYKAAMDHFWGYTFLIFSDDIEWCKNQNWGKHEVIFMEGNSDVDDLSLMSQCRHNIIANSSYSWWASFLNSNPHKKIVAPAKDRWFGPKLQHDTRDLYLPNWIVI